MGGLALSGDSLRFTNFTRYSLAKFACLRWHKSKLRQRLVYIWRSGKKAHCGALVMTVGFLYNGVLCFYICISSTVTVYQSMLVII